VRAPGCGATWRSERTERGVLEKRERRARAGETDEWGRLAVGPS
jgi:hypothetical protein